MSSQRRTYIAPDSVHLPFADRGRLLASAEVRGLIAAGCSSRLQWAVVSHWGRARGHGRAPGELDDAVRAVGGARERVDGVVRGQDVLCERGVRGNGREGRGEDDAQRGDGVLGDPAGRRECQARARRDEAGLTTPPSSCI